jgi:carbon monoxide dehydrogenase subunit G
MIIDQIIAVPAPSNAVWSFVMDLPAVAQCMPGVESVEEIDLDHYTGTVSTSVGPVTLRFQGKVSVVERNQETLQAQLQMHGTDRRSGSVSATMTMTLVPQEDATTEMRIHTDAAIFGTIGEFGQPVIRKKADQILKQFAANLAGQLGSV